MKSSGGLAGRGVLGGGRGEPVFDLSQQAGVAGEAEDAVDPVGLAPGHQLVPGEAGIRPEQDLDARPAHADLGDDARDLFLGTG